jgi:hypothetical protein
VPNPFQAHGTWLLRDGIKGLREGIATGEEGNEIPPRQIPNRPEPI